MFQWCKFKSRVFIILYRSDHYTELHKNVADKAILRNEHSQLDAQCTCLMIALID